MKIAYVLKKFPKISESFILNEIVNLIERGHEVYIFSIKNPKERVQHEEVSKYKLEQRTNYLSNRSGLAKKIEKGFKGISKPNLLFKNSYSMKKSLLVAAAVRDFKQPIKNLEIDVIHSHFNDIASESAKLISNELNIPFTFTAHAYDIFIDPDKNEFRERIHNTEKLITPSNYNKSYIEDLSNLTGERIEVIRACALVEKFEHLERAPEENRILSVARLVEKKGLEYGIEAVGELSKQYPDIEYRIVGSGDRKDDLKDLASRNNTEENITFLDNVNDETLLNEIKRATLFILPAVIAENGDRDVCPLALQEAMIAETPVISTNIASIPELIEDEKSGILVEPRNSGELANSISELLENNELRKKLGRNAKEKVKSDFNINQEVDKLLSVWRSSRDTDEQ